MQKFSYLSLVIYIILFDESAFSLQFLPRDALYTVVHKKWDTFIFR